MSWAGIASNQTVSFANLKNAVDTGEFISKTSQSTSLEQITKADADAYVYIDTSYSPYASKTSNQLVVKSNLRAGFAVYGASYGCVVPDTDILVGPDVTRKADTFDVGDVVYTKHQSTGVWGYHKVEALERKEQPILNISTDLGGIRCSTTHLLLRQGVYVEAKDLTVGDIIFHIEGDAIITDIVSEDTSTVIEFNIEDAHTYVAAGFLAHNKCTVNGWLTCTDACNNGVTAYGTGIYYTAPLGVGTIINTTSCLLGYPRYYYYPGGYLLIDYSGANYQITDMGSCPCQTCSCFLLTNTDTVDISISFYDCGGSTLNPECNMCPAGGQIYLCIQDAFQATYTVHIGTNCTGYTPSFTMTALGSTCTTAGNCI